MSTYLYLLEQSRIFEFKSSGCECYSEYCYLMFLSLSVCYKILTQYHELCKYLPHDYLNSQTP
jgi:hypothetical protein